MPDLLDERLRADAARPDPAPPDLDALLAAVVSTRRRRWMPIAAAAAAVVAAATLVLPASPVNVLPGAGPQTVMSRIVGVTLAYQNPRVLVVFLDIPDHGCARGTFGALLGADEGPRSIRITPPRFTLARATTTGEADPACEVGTFDAVEVYLKTPVAQRSVVDTATGATLDVFDGKAVPLPTYLPAGYRTSTLKAGICTQRRCTDANAIPYVGYAGSIRPPYASRNYLRPDVEATQPRGRLTVYPHGATLDITAGRSTTLRDSTWRTTGHVRIGSSTGTVTETPRGRDRCLTWSPSPGRALQVCTSVPFQPDGPVLAPLLPVDELVRVAQGLR